jgi:hypothetical protein
MSEMNNRDKMIDSFSLLRLQRFVKSGDGKASRAHADGNRETHLGDHP